MCSGDTKSSATLMDERMLRTCATTKAAKFKPHAPEAPCIAQPHPRPSARAAPPMRKMRLALCSVC